MYIMCTKRGALSHAVPAVWNKFLCHLRAAPPQPTSNALLLIFLAQLAELFI